MFKESQGFLSTFKAEPTYYNLFTENHGDEPPPKQLSTTPSAPRSTSRRAMTSHEALPVQFYIEKLGFELSNSKFHGQSPIVHLLLVMVIFHLQQQKCKLTKGFNYPFKVGGELGFKQQKLLDVQQPQKRVERFNSSLFQSWIHCFLSGPGDVLKQPKAEIETAMVWNSTLFSSKTKESFHGKLVRLCVLDGVENFD